jgi:hypothetical protein
MQLNTGLGGGFALGTWPGVQGTSANANPQGPQTAAQQGFGVQATGGANAKLTGHTVGVLSTGTIALGLLLYIWWSLPR